MIYKAIYDEALAHVEPVIHICDLGFIVIARKDLPANNMQELSHLAQRMDGACSCPP